MVVAFVFLDIDADFRRLNMIYKSSCHNIGITTYREHFEVKKQRLPTDESNF